MPMLGETHKSRATRNTPNFRILPNYPGRRSVCNNLAIVASCMLLVPS